MTGFRLGGKDDAWEKLVQGLQNIPRDRVKVKTQGQGLAVVIHLETGIEIARLDRTSGDWEVFHSGFPLDAVAMDETREWAVDSALSPHTHRPPRMTVDLPLAGRQDLSESQARLVFPAAWAWWDRIRPLFPRETS